MFLGFPTLAEDPFGDAPDPRFLYLSDQHAAVAELLASPELLTGGFVTLSGGPGSGKTMLLESFMLDLLEGRAPAACVRVTREGSPLEALRAGLRDLGFSSRARGWPQLLRRMNDHLAQHRATGGSVVLIADDVHELGARAQEEIRLLMGMEISHEPALSVVLAGRAAYGEQTCTTPDGHTIVRQPLVFRLDGMARSETEAYVKHRLAVAGDASCTAFDPAAFDLIHEHTFGLPGRINSLCSTAMLCAYADGLDCVCLETLGSAIEVWQQSAVLEPEPAASSQAHPPCARCRELEQKVLDRERIIGTLRQELDAQPGNGRDADEDADYAPNGRETNGDARNGAADERSRLSMEVAALSEAVTSLRKQLDKAASERAQLRKELEQAEADNAALAARQPQIAPAAPARRPPAHDGRAAPELAVRESEPHAVPPAAHAAWSDEVHGGALIALDGEKPGGKHPIRSRRMNLGSAADNDIVIRSGFASPRHAQIVSAAGACVLHDLGSTNGTFVNTRRIRRHVLRDGDVIRIGRRHFEYVERDARAQSEAPAPEDRAQSIEHHEVMEPCNSP